MRQLIGISARSLTIYLCLFIVIVVGTLPVGSVLCGDHVQQDCSRVRFTQFFGPLAKHFTWIVLGFDVRVDGPSQQPFRLFWCASWPFSRTSWIDVRRSSEGRLRKRPRRASSRPADGDPGRAASGRWILSIALPGQPDCLRALSGLEDSEHMKSNNPHLDAHPNRAQRGQGCLFDGCSSQAPAAFLRPPSSPGPISSSARPRLLRRNASKGLWLSARPRPLRRDARRRGPTWGLRLGCSLSEQWNACFIERVLRCRRRWRRKEAPRRDVRHRHCEELKDLPQCISTF